MFRRGILILVVAVLGVLLGANLVVGAKPPAPGGIVALAHIGSSLWAAHSDGTIFHSEQGSDGFAGGSFTAVGHVPGTPVAIAASDGHGDVYVALANLYWAIAPGPGPVTFTLRRSILTP